MSGCLECGHVWAVHYIGRCHATDDRTAPCRCTQDAPHRDTSPAGGQGDADDAAFLEQCADYGVRDGGPPDLPSDRLRAIATQLRALRAALANAGAWRHAFSCPVPASYLDDDCTCGLTAAARALAPAPGGAEPTQPEGE